MPASRWSLSQLELHGLGPDGLERYRPGEALDIYPLHLGRLLRLVYREVFQEELSNSGKSRRTKFVLYYVLEASLALCIPSLLFFTEERLVLSG